MHHIHATLPDIKARITSQLQKYNAELLSLGGPLGDGNSSSIVLSLITEFTNEFRTVIDGNTTTHRLIDPFGQVKDGDIRTILYSSSVRPKFLSRCSVLT
jgi:hypothetical protein